MNNTLTLFREIVRVMEPSIGCTATAISYMNLYRYSQETIPMPEADTPYLYFVLDGSMRLYTPSGMMDYIAGQYSVSAIDTPKSAKVLTFSAQQDFLALSVAFTLEDVLSVMLDLDAELTTEITDGLLSEADMAEADKQVSLSFFKLVSQLKHSANLSFFSKHIKREIIYYVLCGSCGKQFLQSMIGIQQSGEIYEINSWIKQNFRDSFTVNELAEKQNMSVSLLHQKFKCAVGMGVLQCQKRLRLTEARRVMLDEGKNVTEAALEVGYESVSQFTREYKKMYGKTPKEDIQQLKKQLKK